MSSAKAAARNGGGVSAVLPLAKLAAITRFDAIFVDEAGQSTEPELLTPLRLAYAGHVLPMRSASMPNGGSCLGLPVEADSSGLWATVPPWASLSACLRLVLVGDPLQVSLYTN